MVIASRIVLYCGVIIEIDKFSYNSSIFDIDWFNVDIVIISFVIKNVCSISYCPHPSTSLGLKVNVSFLIIIFELVLNVVSIDPLEHSFFFKSIKHCKV